MKKWNRVAMHISTCRYLSRRRILAISFRNGDRLQIPTNTLLKTPAPATSWEKVRNSCRTYCQSVRSSRDGLARRPLTM